MTCYPSGYHKDKISMALQSPTHSPPSDKWIIKESSWNIMAWAAVIFWAGYMLAARLSKDLVMILFGISMCNFNICHQETDQKNHCQHIVLRTAGQQYSFPGSTASHRECRVDPQCGIALLNFEEVWHELALPGARCVPFGARVDILDITTHFRSSMYGAIYLWYHLVF